MPRVSVVVPTFRRPQFLRRAVDSVMRQTIDSWELIIVDDNDPDWPERRETEAVVAEYSTDRRVRYIRNPRNIGGGAARNAGIRAAGSEFVSFLDDDDEWHPTKLQRQLDCIEAAPADVALVYCRVRVVNAVTGREALRPTDGRSHSVRDLLRRNTIGTTSAVLCRASALHEVGLFDEALPARQDLDLYIRIAQRYALAFVDEPLVTLFVHGRARISTDFAGSIRALELFVEKHRSLIEADGEAQRALRYQLGYLLVAATRYPEARTVLLAAWRADPADLQVITRLAMTYSVPRAVARSAKRSLRWLRAMRS